MEPEQSGSEDGAGPWNVQLQSDSFDRQVSALQQISRDRDVRGVTVAAVRLAGSPHDEVRIWAAEALESSIQPVTDEAQELTDLLRESGDGETCYWTSTMLGRIGEAIGELPGTAEAAVDALERCLKDSLYLPARERAAWALRRLGPVSKSALPTLKEIASDAPPRLQRLTNEAVKALDAAA